MSFIILPEEQQCSREEQQIFIAKEK